MKSAIFLLGIFLISASFAYQSFDYSSEYDLIEDLKDHDDKIYILFLYSSKSLNAQGYESVHHKAVNAQILKDRTDSEHDAIKSYADLTSEVYYSEFDLVNTQHDSVLNELGVDKADVFSWPITVVVQNGNGYQVTGPNSIYFVKRIVTDLTSSGQSDVEVGTHMPDGFVEPPTPNQPEGPRGEVEPVVETVVEPVVEAVIEDDEEPEEIPDEVSETEEIKTVDTIEIPDSPFSAEGPKVIETVEIVEEKPEEV